MAEARREYEANLAETYRIMNEALEITQEGEAILNAEAIGQERALAARYREYRLVATGNYEFNAQGKMIEVQRGFVGRQMNKFYNWYGSVNAGGKTFSKGGLKKAGVLGGVSAVAGGAAGLAAGVVLAPVGGLVVAGLGAGYLANRITKAYMATHINKKSHDVNDQHAQSQHDELIADHENESNTRSMADIIDDQAKREVWRNKKRAALTIGTMAVSTVVGGVAGGLIHEKFFDRSNTAHAAAQATEGEGAPDDGGKLPVATPGETAGFQTAVNVEAGHGYAHEISDLFAQKGIHLSPAQSYEAYQHLEQKFPGGNFFTDNNSYSMGGDYGIGRSGSSHWNEAVVRDLDAWAKARNLG